MVAKILALLEHREAIELIADSLEPFGHVAYRLAALKSRKYSLILHHPKENRRSSPGSMVISLNQLTMASEYWEINHAVSNVG